MFKTITAAKLIERVPMLKRKSPALRTGLLFAMGAIVGITTVSCGDDSVESSAVTSTVVVAVQPTFVRIAVTPYVPGTPDPTIVSSGLGGPRSGGLGSAGPGSTDPSSGEPEFPANLDPEVSSARPDDDTIFSGWTEYLLNTSLNYSASQSKMHLCAGGVVMNDAGLDQYRQKWRIERSATISESDWGSVAVIVDIIGGRWEGREVPVLVLTRRSGKVFVTNNISPGPVEISRSQPCLGN